MFLLYGWGFISKYACCETFESILWSLLDFHVIFKFINETCTYLSEQMQISKSGPNGKFYLWSQRRDKNERCIIKSFFSIAKTNINLISPKCCACNSQPKLMSSKRAQKERWLCHCQNKPLP